MIKCSPKKCQTPKEKSNNNPYIIKLSIPITNYCNRGNISNKLAKSKAGSKLNKASLTHI